MSKSILIVDDHESYAAQLASSLRSHSFRAQHVTSAKAALEMLQSIRFDALVTDIYMPERDGIELLRLVKAQIPSLPVIGMTADHSELASVIERIFRHTGGLAMIHKPVAVTELVELLAALPDPSPRGP